LASRRDLQRRMGAAARAAIEGRFSDRQLAASLLTAYRAIAGECGNHQLLTALQN
jgi:hypothetical protein